MRVSLALALLGMILLSGCNFGEPSPRDRETFSLFAVDRNAKLVRDSLRFFDAMSADPQVKGQIHQAILTGIDANSSFDRPLSYEELYGLILQIGRAELNQVNLAGHQKEQLIETFRNHMLRIDSRTLTAGVGR